MNKFKDINNSEETKTEKEELADLLKSIAIFEAKSAIAKLKLLKYAAEKGAHSIGKAVDKASKFIENKNTNSIHKHK
ncbi:MAG: hypothetical protein ACOWWH_11865 [Eubacteriaceae bacterium]